MPDLFDRDDHPDSPTTRFICWLLKEDRSRIDATRESRRLKLPDEVGRFYWQNMRRR